MGCVLVFAICCLNRLPSEVGPDCSRSPNILSERTHLHRDEMRFHWYFLLPPEGKQGLCLHVTEVTFTFAAEMV
jgi:hypothetical protein